MAQATYYPDAGYKSVGGNTDIWYDDIPGVLTDWTDETALSAPEIGQLAANDTNGPSVTAAYDGPPPPTGWRPGGILFRWPVTAAGTLTQIDLTIKGYLGGGQGAKLYVYNFDTPGFELKGTEAAAEPRAFEFTPTINSGCENYRDGSNHAWGLLCTTDPLGGAQVQLRFAKWLATYSPGAVTESPMMFGVNI